MIGFKRRKSSVCLFLNVRKLLSARLSTLEIICMFGFKRGKLLVYSDLNLVEFFLYFIYRILNNLSVFIIKNYIVSLQKLLKSLKSVTFKTNCNNVFVSCLFPKLLHRNCSLFQHKSCYKL